MITLGRIRFSLRRIIAFGFTLIILNGSLLLTLLIASKDGESLDFVDSLFTATSVTCVTGLAVRDTRTHFTSFDPDDITALDLLLLRSFIGFFVNDWSMVGDRKDKANSDTDGKTDGLTAHVETAALTTREKVSV